MKVEAHRTTTASTVVMPSDDNVTTIGSTDFTVYLFGGANIGQVYTVNNDNSVGIIRVQDESSATIDDETYVDLLIGESITVIKQSASRWKIK